MSEPNLPLGNGFDDTAGWVAIPGFLSAEDVVAVLGFCHELLASPPEQQRPRDRVGAGTQHLCELDSRSEHSGTTNRSSEPRPALQLVWRCRPDPDRS